MLLVSSKSSKWRLMQILLQHARGNSQRSRLKFSQHPVLHYVYGKSLSILFSAEAQAAIVLDSYFDVQYVIYECDLKRGRPKDLPSTPGKRNRNSLQRSSWALLFSLYGH